jgi:hypothetical protein
LTAHAGFGVIDLAELLGGAGDPEPVGTVIARMQQVAGGLDRFADACGDTSLIHDARVLATAARRAGRDFTTALSRLRPTAGAGETATDTTDSAVTAATRSGELA